MSIWFTARGAGLSALVLLSLSTCLGALVSRSAAKARLSNPPRRYLVQYLHRACAGLGLTVLVLHISTVLADSYAHVGLTGALIPFTSGYRPTAVALGSLSAYTFVGVAVLGLARGRMAASPRAARVWRRLHALAYLGWASAMLHGFTAGSDSSVGWVRLMYAASLVAVLGSVAVRLVHTAATSRADRFAAPTPVPALVSGAPR
jgi:sulfoxide reductase heme-binding subunit YedZ